MTIIEITSIPINSSSITIRDTQSRYKIEDDKDYILYFTTGKTTLPAFKELYLKKKRILFFVVNLEYFFYKMSFFKNFEVKFLKNEKQENVYDMEEKYIKLEKKLGSKDVDKGVELSFRPNVFKGIKSSFLKPSSYFSEENISTLIYKELAEAKNYEELKDIIYKKYIKALKSIKKKEIFVYSVFEEDFDNLLKSLIFTGIVKKKEDMFYRNELCI